MKSSMEEAEEVWLCKVSDSASEEKAPIVEHSERVFRFVGWDTECRDSELDWDRDVN